MSKRATAIEIMKANEGKSMAEVLVLIAEAIGVTEAGAKSYYKWIVANGKAPGVVEKTARAPKQKSEKTPKQKAPKLIKPKIDMSGIKEKKPITDKTAEEIADIRNKNLARLKAVGKKYMKGQYAEGNVGGFSKKEAKEAREYVDAVSNDLDSFKSPEFLTSDEVRALV